MKPRSAFALVALLLLALPVPAVKKDTQLVLDEIQRLSAAIDQISAQVAELLKKSAITDERVAAVAGSQADLSQSKESFMLSVQFLKEELNGLKDSVGKLNDKLQNVSVAAPPVTPDGAGETAAGGGNAAVMQDPSGAYYAAYSDYIKENFDLAIEGFRQFIRSFPESGLADNSLYWIGECLYAKKKYQEAINVFNELLAKYKDGDKAPAAILKKGYAAIEMGRQDEGVAVLKELISRFPLSEEDSLAQQKIKELSE